MCACDCVHLAEGWLALMRSPRRGRCRRSWAAPCSGTVFMTISASPSRARACTLIESGVVERARVIGRSLSLSLSLELVETARRHRFPLSFPLSPILQ